MSDDEALFFLRTNLHPDGPLREVFCAALTGFIANKDFHGPISQGHPQAAVEFALSVVRALNTMTPKEEASHEQA